MHSLRIKNSARRIATCTLIKVNASTTTAASDSRICQQTPNPTKISTDMIGPVDPVSNLRKVIFKQPPHETHLEKRYRLLRAEAQDWNKVFWTAHNSRFFQEREQYLKENLPEGKQSLTADEMSVFYKAFLDKNWSTHVTYNIEWYKKNFLLLGLAIKIKISNLFKSKQRVQ